MPHLVPVCLNCRTLHQSSRWLFRRFYDYETNLMGVWSRHDDFPLLTYQNSTSTIELRFLPSLLTPRRLARAIQEVTSFLHDSNLPTNLTLLIDRLHNFCYSLGEVRNCWFHHNIIHTFGDPRFYYDLFPDPFFGDPRYEQKKQAFLLRVVGPRRPLP